MSYRKQITCLLLLSTVLTCARAQHPFTIAGTIAPQYDGSVIKLSFADNAVQPITTTAQNGRFNLSGKIAQEFEYVRLSIEKDHKRVGGAAFFIKGANMNMQIRSLKDQSSPTDISYTNVPFIAEQAEYNAMINPVLDSQVIASGILFTVEKGIRKGLDKDSMTAVVKSLLQQKHERTLQFVQQHPAAYISLHIFNSALLNSKRSHPDSLLHTFLTFDTALQASNLGKSVLARIQIKRALLLHQMAPNFSFSTDKNLHHDLSSFRQNKNVLLCFWASWCGPCIKNLPLLKKINQTYNGKDLQLISVSIDKDPHLWQQALNKYQLPWPQTCDLPAFIEGPQIRSLYDINYIPQYFLIDKNGRLIYHNTQSHDVDDTYAVLQKILADLLP